ncbi:MAG: ion transporter [Myxococcota bacterium]
MSFKDSLWHTLNDPADDRYGIFSTFITTLILISVALVFVQLNLDPGSPLYQQLELIDRVILLVFALEFFGRLWVIRNWRPQRVRLSPFEVARYFLMSRLRFILSPWGLIDFLALLPLVPFLRSLRILRLLRLLRSVSLFRYASPARALFGALQRNAVLFSVVFGVLGVSVTISAVMFFFAEYSKNPGIDDFLDAMWWALVTITTVGYGDLSPVTVGGRLIGSGLMIAGMFVIALFAGVISSTLVDQLLPLQQEQVRMSSLSDHFIVTGWNENVPMLLQQLEQEHSHDVPPVLIFAPIARPPGLDPNYLYIRGDFTLDTEWDKVRLDYARSVVIVADDTDNSARPGTRDATTVLTVFTVRGLERRFTIERREPLHITAEILLPENVRHAKTAGANEVLATALVGNSLLAHTASNPGVSDVMNTLLLTARDNIYTCPIPSELISGQTRLFSEIHETLRRTRRVLVIGIVHRGEVILNPDFERPIFLDDRIIYLADRPVY